MLPDGRELELNQPVAVAELMLEHPGNFVIEFRPTSTSKLLPLAADYRLDPQKVYLMVPMARGKGSGVSVEEARRIVLGARPMMIRSMKFPLVGMCMVGASTRKEMMVGDLNGESMGGAGNVEEMEISIEGIEKEAKFLCRQYSSKGWKPSLGTIQERNFEKKTPHWLF